jgi:hypothetical protein
VSGGLSIKLAAVLVAFAFVGAFKLHTLGGDDPEAAGVTLSPSGASALASDTAVVKAPSGISSPALVRVVKLPALQRAPKPPRHAVPSHASSAVTHTVVPSATVAPSTPNVTPHAPAQQSTPKSSYVGKSFDSKG